MKHFAKFSEFLNESYEFRTLDDMYDEEMGDHMCLKFFTDHGLKEEEVYVVTNMDAKRYSTNDETPMRYLKHLNNITKTAYPVETKIFKRYDTTELTLDFYEKPFLYVHCFYPRFYQNEDYWYMFPKEELKKSLKGISTSIDFGL